MKLLLTSAGFENPKIGRKFLELVGKPASQIKVVFVPTAAVTKREKYYVGKCREDLLGVGVVKNNIKPLELDHRIKYKEVEGFDVIYVCSGNTFYLLEQARKSGFGKIIRQFLEKGGLYLGVSAGSYIVCPTIEAAGWKPRDSNIVRLKNLRALNLVPFLVIAHYTPDYEKILAPRIAKSRYEVKKLKNSQAVLVLNNRYNLVE